MSQNDFNIANQGFPATRADINSALQALASNSAGTAEPSTTYAYQFWYDETNELLKMRNSDNDAWITIGTFDQVADTFTPAGVTTDKIEEGNSSVEVVDTGTGYVAITVDGVEAARVDANGRLGIRTTSPEANLHIKQSGADKNGIKIERTDNTAEYLLLSNHNGSSRIYGVDENGVGRSTVSFGGSEDGSTFNEHMRINSSGFVGINTTSPVSLLHVQKSGGGSNAFLKFTDATYGGDVRMGMPDGINNDYVAGTWAANNARFFTDGVERVRIDTSGNLLVGTTSNPSAGKIAIDYARGSSAGMRIKDTVGSGGTGVIADFYNSSNVSVGSITHNSSSTSFNTTSDYRLKENLTPLDGASDRLAQIPVHRFNFIANPDTTVDGFLAHEVQAIVPEAVHGEKDGMRLEQYEVEPALGEIYTPAQLATYDEEGVELIPATDEVIHSTNIERPADLLDGQQWRETTPAVMGEREVPEYQGIDQSKLVPLLTAALQEALQKIDALEARVTALGG